MALEVVKIQGSNGVTKDVLLDSITGQTYSIPIYKLGIGAVGTDDGVISATNPMPMVSKGGFISISNSTTTTLAADETFTGVGEDVTNYASLSVTYSSDVVGAASGLTMEFSTDNVNWDRVLIGNLTEVTDQVHRLSVVNKFFRVVYVNGSTIQASFRLQVVYHSHNSLTLINRAGQPQNTIDCQLVRQAGDIDLDFARKHILGGRSFFFFGFNNDIDVVWEDIHPNGGDINWQTTAAKIEVLSSNVNDTITGAGVRQVEVHGLSATGEDQYEVIDMDGTTPVESSLTYIRVNKFHSEFVGTYGGSHQGDITCRVTGGGDVLSLMSGVEGAVDSGVQYGLGEAGNGYWTVPLNKVLYITDLTVVINSKANQTMDVVLYEREGILNTSGSMDPRRVIWEVSEVSGDAGEIHKSFKSHIKIKQLTDLYFRAIGSGTNNRIFVSLDFYLLDRDASGA